MFNFQDILAKLFKPQTVACSRNEQVVMDDPAYAQLDPHLRFDESEDQKEPDDNDGMPPSRFKRKPPSMEALMSNVKAVTKKVEHVKGFKFEIAPALSNNFHMSSSWNIPNSVKGSGGDMQMSQSQMQNPGKSTQSNFLLALQYVGGSMQQLMENKPSIIMTGRWDSTGKLEAALIKKINDHVSLRLTSAFLAGSDLNYSQMHLDCDIEGEDYSHTIKYGTGLFSISHMQTIGKNLVLGFEMMNLIERKMTMINYAFRYNYKRHKFYCQYTAPADSLCFAYLLNLKRRAHLISELNYQPSEGETSQVLGFQQRFATSEIIATVNTKGKISTVLNMFGSTYALKLCAICDYKKDSYKFGYGLTMGQVQN